VVLGPQSDTFNIRRIASGLLGFGSGCSAIQASSAASSSGYNRRPMFGPMPVLGRPLPLFSEPAIAAPLK
jgi:hypothetical protein